VHANACEYYYCRYDVALDVNVMGVKHLCHLAKHCANRPQDVHACLHWSVVGVLRPIISVYTSTRRAADEQQKLVRIYGLGPIKNF
jgi:hypothetical protein